MVRRGFCYYGVIVPRYYLLALPGTLLLSAVCYRAPFEVRSGIRVLDHIPQTRADFTNAIGAALTLLARADAIRFSRVRAEIRTIVNTLGIVGSNYQRPLRLCALNLKSYYDTDHPNPELAVQLLASSFVRDATLGCLFTRGIVPNHANRLRVDSLCCREAQRFMQRLGLTRTPWDPKSLVDVSASAALAFAATDIFASFLHDHAAEARDHGRRL